MRDVCQVAGQKLNGAEQLHQQAACLRAQCKKSACAHYFVTMTPMHQICLRSSKMMRAVSISFMETAALGIKAFPGENTNEVAINCWVCSTSSFWQAWSRSSHSSYSTINGSRKCWLFDSISVYFGDVQEYIHTNFKFASRVATKPRWRFLTLQYLHSSHVGNRFTSSKEKEWLRIATW